MYIKTTVNRDVLLTVYRDIYTVYCQILVNYIFIVIFDLLNFKTIPICSTFFPTL